jgi:hypothetical protein
VASKSKEVYHVASREGSHEKGTEVDRMREESALERSGYVKTMEKRKTRLAFDNCFDVQIRNMMGSRVTL